jgi:multicomponent K+:H+ antiporter subunit E
VLPFPVLWLLLAAMWLALYGTLAPAHIILAAIVALGAIGLYRALQAPQVSLRRPGTALALIGLVLIDIVRSNISVARIVLDPKTRGRTAGFVEIPLDLSNPVGLAALACIITATPGTAWSGYNSTSGVLTMHILDLVDDETWVRTIKDRYERRLMEIFR